MRNVLEIENLSKVYQLGSIDQRTFFEDFNCFFRLGRGSKTSKIDDFNKPLKANNLSMKLKALDNINLQVKQGEAVAILGLNGAGKSTLLKIISRVTTPTSGLVRIKGNLSSLLEVGTGFHPELSGRENIYLNGTILGMKKHEIKSKFDQIVSFAGVEQFIDTPTKRYSSGMIVRLGFAIASHLEPDILVVDEVLAVGDQEFQRKSIERIKESTSAGKTIIIVSHNLNQVSYLSEKSIWLEKGQVKEIGDTAKILEMYKQSYSKSPACFDTSKRKGIGEIQVQEVLFNDNNQVRSGKDLRIKLKIHSTKASEIRIAIRFDRGFDKIILLDSFLIRKSIKINPGFNEIQFSIERLILLPENYGYTVFCEDSMGIQDWLINAGTLSVEDGDFYQTGLTPPKEQAFVLQNFEVDTNPLP